MADVLSALDNKTANTCSPPMLRRRKIKVAAAPAAQQAAATACSTSTSRIPDRRVRLLAVAFNQSKAPSTRAIYKLARRCQMQPKEVEDWFERRNALELWYVCIVTHFSGCAHHRASASPGVVCLMPLHMCATMCRVNKHNFATAGAIVQALTQCKVRMDAEKEMAQIGVRAATFRATTFNLIEAAAAADEGEEDMDGMVVAGTPGTLGATGMDAAEGSNYGEDAPPHGAPFAFDALTLLAESSSKAAACRSPHEIEAAFALGASFGSAPAAAVAV